MSFINNWDKERSRLDFEIDGVVIKVNNIKFQKQLGFTSKYPRWSIAYKFKTEQVSTKLLSVSYQLGRTGAVTPVANLESVLLGGTYVKRASLHNQDQINKLDLYFNDHVFIEKGGEIIPKIVGVEFEKRDLYSEKIKFIKNCPSCNHVLVRSESESHHYCLNTDNCAPQIIGRIQHFISRKAMDINGIGNETVDLLYKSGLVLNYADLYDLKKENLVVLERMAEKSIDNIYSGLEESKEIGFERVLFAIGIRHVGQTVAKNLAKEFKSIDNLISKTYEDLLLIDEIGERISKSIIDFFNIKNNLELIDRLRNFGLQFEIIENDKGLNDVLSDCRFVISGIFEINSRDELKKTIEDHGGKVSSSITSKTSYLVGGNNIGPSKLIKANSLGISIISENELNDLIKSKL
jgi:DNA ligase (NAD+)